MQAVTAISSSSRTSFGPDRGRAPRVEADKPESRAVVPLRPAPRVESRGHYRPSAAFLAHLIATRERVPQTRERRRAEPAEAMLAYATPRLLLPPPPKVIEEA